MKPALEQQPACSSVRPVIAAVLGHVLWGFSVMFSRLALQTASPDVLLSIRFLLSVIIMAVMLPLKQGRISLRGKNIKPLVLLAVTELSYFYFESYGILYTNATFAGVVLAVVPVVAIVMGILFLKEYPSKRQAVFCLLPVAGVVIMTVSGSSLGIVRPLGLVFLICSCVSSAAYKTANRKSSEEFTPFERTFFVLASCAVVFTASALISTGGNLELYLKPLRSPVFLFSVFMLCIFCSIGANMLVNYAAARMPVVKLSSFGSLTTLCSMFAGVLFLNEPMTIYLFIGAALILIGIHQVAKN